jgi:orotidine-5'-phosphate decarboxylase
VSEVIVALDVGSFDEAAALVARLGERATFFKVGLELYAAAGPRTVGWLRDRGCRVFVDLKAYDIPNTVRGVARSAAAAGASLLTVHAIGGRAMLDAAVEGAGRQDGSGCGILAVTVLTSFDGAGYGAALGRGAVDIASEVERLAALADDAGLHGVVCSGHEAGRVRHRFGGRLRTLVPGVRPAGSSAHDQVRTATPGEAVRAGASYIVVGRAITGAADPAAAFARIADEMAQETLPQAP